MENNEVYHVVTFEGCYVVQEHKGETTTSGPDAASGAKVAMNYYAPAVGNKRQMATGSASMQDITQISDGLVGRFYNKLSPRKIR